MSMMFGSLSSLLSDSPCLNISLMSIRGGRADPRSQLPKEKAGTCISQTFMAAYGALGLHGLSGGERCNGKVFWR